MMDNINKITDTQKSQIIAVVTNWNNSIHHTDADRANLLSMPTKNLIDRINIMIDEFNSTVEDISEAETATATAKTVAESAAVTAQAAAELANDIVDCVPQDLSILDTITITDNTQAYLYVDNNGTRGKVSASEVGTKIRTLDIGETAINLNIGDFVFQKEN